MTTADERAASLQQAIRLKRASTRPRASELAPRPPDQAAQLGEMQQSLWLLHQIDPRWPGYNLSSAFRVQGPIDASRLQLALNEVVSRHRLLRSSYRVDRDTVLQVIHPHSPLAVEVLRLAPGRAQTAAIEEARRPFDLETGPLVRMALLEEVPDGERLLLLVVHHILSDERSLGFLWRELAAAYHGRLSESHPAIQYDDYVHWSRQRVSAKRQQDLDYWRRRLDPLPEDLQLPFESPAGEAGDPRGRLSSRTVAATVQQGIRRLATATGTSPFMVHAFAFRLLLDRYTHGRRVAFAIPVSMRSHPATANMIGYFLNPLVIPSVVDEEHSVEDALRDSSRELREALTHASLPFQALIEELSPPRRLDRHPIFQVMFVYQETDPPPDLGGSRLVPVALDLGESKFDLSLIVSERETSLEVAVEYSTDRFAEVWMQNLLGHYETLLEHLPEDLARATSTVPMLKKQEESRLAADAHGPGLSKTATALLPGRILDHSRRSPQTAAVTCGGVRWSYGELADSGRSIAQELLVHGVEKDDRVGLFLDRSPLMIAGILGCHWAAAAYVPLDPRYPLARNREVLADADVAAVVTTSNLRHRLPAGSWKAIDADTLRNDGQTKDLREVSPEAAAYILYTSGSTGRPKGVVVSHGNLRASNDARLETYDFDPARFLLLPSLAFDSSVAGVFWTLATAGTLVIPTEDEARDPRRLSHLIAEQRVRSLLCVPSLYTQLLQVGADRLRGLEAAIVAGERCPSRLVEEHFRVLPQVRLFNEYGPTEATVWATVEEITERDGGRPVAIGRPIPGVRIDVLDGLGRRVPAGISGQAWIGGATVAQGYWRRPELSDERFEREPGGGERRYRTGDRMAWTEDGRLLFLGRDDEQIKHRGFRIEPGDIEAALLDLPGVERAAVIARSLGPATADPLAQQLVAFLQGAGVGASWRQELARRLPDHMVPSRLVELPELPLLPNGKIDRQRLRSMALDPEVRAGEAGPDASSPVPGNREQALISLWEGLLGRSGIGPSDNFFELGGHSLLVVEMTLAIERDFEVSLSAAEVFESPTVREIARRIEQRGGPATTYEHLYPIQPGGRRSPLVVALPHFFTAMLAERFRGERPVYGLRGVGLRAEGNLGRWRSMKELGEELVEEIQRRFPGETCVLAGYSFGASMAVEAVRLMEERDLPVHRLYLIAPMPVDIYRLGPFRLQLDGLDKPVAELSLSEALRRYARDNDPLTRRPYRRAWRRLAVEPWRRLLCWVGRMRRWAGLPLTQSILWADVRVDRFRLHARYRPGVVRTPTVFFNASEPETDAAATWRPFFQGPFTVHEIPDPHLDEASVEAARRAILHHLADLGDS